MIAEPRSPSTLSILREARGLCAGGWTQGVYACGKSGCPVSEFGRAAVCFCAKGALNRASRRKFGLCDEANEALEAQTGSCGVVNFNDAPGRTQAEVLAAFDAAIARLETPHAR